MPNREAVRLLVLLLTAGVLALAAPAIADEQVPRPVLNLDFPDPAVVATQTGLVAYSTGDRVPHAWSRSADGPWRRGPGLLTHRPAWSREGGIWAVDVARVEGQWLLYYATPVRGIGETGRCIGVARADSARGPFRPVGRAPLVCPTYARTPAAQDPLLPRDPTLPRAGVIDPSWFRDADGTPYLLYKTDRIPSTVRIVALAPSGQRVAPGATSLELVRSEGVLENPVVTPTARGLRDAHLRGRLDALRLRHPLAPHGDAARLGGGRVRDAARRRHHRRLRAGRCRPRRGQRTPDAGLPARLDVPRRRPPVRRTRQVGPQAASSVDGGRCTPPSWAGSAVCPRSPTGSGLPDT